MTPLTPENLEKARKICKLIMYEGISLRKACQETGMSKTAFLQIAEKSKEISDHYTQAVVCRADRHAEEILDIVDGQPQLNPSGGVDMAYVNMLRLRVDTRKWLMAKMAPKKYGDKIEHSGSVTIIRLPEKKEEGAPVE